MSNTYSIRDLAKEFDITTRTIRFYEEKGLLNPSRNGQTRVFSAGDRTRLKLILRGKRLGLTLEESSDIIGMYEHGNASNNSRQLQTLIEKIREKQVLLKQQQEDLNIMLLDLRDAEANCLYALASMNSEKTA